MPAPTAPDAQHALCVLASGSRGNCSLLRSPRRTISPTRPASSPAGRPTLTLLDLGLSPRRTSALLEWLGFDLADIDAVLLTHLDHDHCHAGWCVPDCPLPPHVEVFLPRSHLGRARRQGFSPRRISPFRDRFLTPAGLAVDPLMQFHDSLGAASFRLHTPAGRLGYATDLGQVTDHLVTHLRGVDVLAIESNYCPQLQVDSDRPDFLKQRIMGGRGHLSNQEAAEAVRRIAPRDHVVFLHLSQQCNHPDLVRALHAGVPYGVTLSAQDAPTQWIPLRGQAESPLSEPARQGMLFE